MKKNKVNKWFVAFPSVLALTVIAVLFYFQSKPTESGNKYEREREEREKEEREKAGFDQPNGFNDFYRLITTPIGKHKSSYPTNYSFIEYKKAIRKAKQLKSSNLQYEWIQRGPGNVGGRTRAIIVDPDDPIHQTWIAASVSGGIWRTTNGGESWTNLTDNLPNLATNTMTMALSNHNIIYVGTGEGYGGVGMVGGNGIFVTYNRGESWEILESTTEEDNFRFVNKIFVDPVNSDIIVAATNKGIFKSVNAGSDWNTVYSQSHMVQDLVANPKNPSVMYAAVNSLGIIKSYNKGDTWVNCYEGIGDGKRFSLAISEVDTSYIYTSVETPAHTTELYISSNSAKTWNKLNDYDNTFIDFFNAQGWFNNVIAAHPFESKKVFIGGVYLGSVEFKSTVSESEDQVLRVDTVGTGSFLNFVKFGGAYFSGCMSTGLDEDAEVEAEDFVSVEIRFGPGISQKAYRFTVPEGEGPSVPVDDYSYQNYVTVPFQVWDIANNKQLMVSFRDQERDGKFNLIDRDPDEIINGREYIYIHSLSYSETPNSNIAQTGGHYYKMLYFFWPELPDDGIWNESSLPVSKLEVKYGKFTLQNATTTVLADNTRNEDLHVDHHDLKMIVTDAANKEFTVLNANDGGLGISEDGGDTWRQIKNGYITTQFYGVAKKPGANEFFGGMQDNGTWKSPENQDASSTSEYEFEIAGDGFEALWHPVYSQRIIGSWYYNNFKVSIDGGKTWKDGSIGIADDDGPFVSRLSNSPQNPNLVFAVGNKGVYRHSTFCTGSFGWNLVELGTGWVAEGFGVNTHNVKVSLADPNIVWAGGGMHDDPDMHVFISKNKGLAFDTVHNFYNREMGDLTSIATHPTDPATAYILFSMPDLPKIIRTTDYGDSWADITGFGQDSSSSNGFPDVMVYSLLVMPHNTNIIWAGTEIGIFESTNSGASWHFANNGLPAVSVWQMFIQDNTIVVASHGRGIWTTSLYPVGNDNPLDIADDQFDIYPNPSTGIVHLDLTSDDTGNAEVHIFDLTGKEVYSTQINKDELNIDQQLNLDLLISGTYVVSVKLDDKVYNSKLIIQ